MNLTHPQLTLTIPTLVQQVPALWLEHHFKKEMPTARLIHRLRIQIQKFYGRHWLGRESVQGYLSLLFNPTNVYRQILEQIKRLTLSFKKEVNTMLQPNFKALNSEQNTLDKLNQSFINVCFAYADLNAYLSKADLEISPCRFVWITSEIANLSEELEALRTSGAK